MKNLIFKTGICALFVCMSSAAMAEKRFGIGVKAGTLGVGLEGTLRATRYLDIRFGINRFDYDDSGSQAGVNYDATLELDSYYATGNLRFPLTPFRLTAGVYSNGNQFVMTSTDSDSYSIGGSTYSSAEVGRLTSETSFSSTAPYAGVGYDFSLLGKVGVTLDLGVLWQGSPIVTLRSDGAIADNPAFQTELENERQQLESEFKDAKAWPVASLGFFFNF